MTLISNRDIPYVVKKNPSLKSVELVYGLPGKCINYNCILNVLHSS